MPGADAQASIALRFIRAHKPLHEKAAVLEEDGCEF
jgi:hypothetical protein